MVAVASAASERQWRVAKGNHGRARPGLTWVASTSADGGGAWSSRYRLWNLSQTHHERSHTFQFFLASKHLLTDERLYTTLPVLTFWLHASRRSGFGVSRSISTQILHRQRFREPCVGTILTMLSFRTKENVHMTKFQALRYKVPTGTLNHEQYSRRPRVLTSSDRLRGGLFAPHQAAMSTGGTGAYLIIAWNQIRGREPDIGPTTYFILAPQWHVVPRGCHSEYCRGVQ